MANTFIKKDDLLEGLQEQELRDLVHDEIHIDEFQAKMGEDDQIIVVSFKVKYRPVAADLESFLEKGYDFILDAEASKSEFEDGWYLVFVEFERRAAFPVQLLQTLRDMRNITNVSGWKFRYGPARSRNVPEWEISKKKLKEIVPLSPKKYREIKSASTQLATELDNLLMAGEVKSAPKDMHITESQYNLRTAAGLPTSGYKISQRGKR